MPYRKGLTSYLFLVACLFSLTLSFPAHAKPVDSGPKLAKFQSIQKAFATRSVPAKLKAIQEALAVAKTGGKNSTSPKSALGGKPGKKELASAAAVLSLRKKTDSPTPLIPGYGETRPPRETPSPAWLTAAAPM